jgi:beta-lactam-binding protein with PASTA domain
MKFFKSKVDTTEKFTAKQQKFFAILTVGMLLLMGIVAVSIFFVSVKGAEQTLVPEIRGKELTEALLELQVKELYPRIQLRYSQSSRDKGYILEQEPRAGTIVKAGRLIRLVVSEGVMINRVEKYVGRNIDDVRMDLLTIAAASGGPLLSLKEPLMYDFSPEAPGTILQQRPEPGSDVSGPMTLEFVVSRGLENIPVTVPQFTGLALSAALEQIGRLGTLVVFSLRELNEGEKEGTVVHQEPSAGTGITSNAAVNLVVSIPAELGENEVFKLFTYTMPRNPYPLPVRLEVLPLSGERYQLINVNYPGGRITVPYRLPVGSVLILSMMNMEIYRETVQR